MYRTAVEAVEDGDYSIPLGKARIAREGSDLTLVGWGQQVVVLEQAVRGVCVWLGDGWDGVAFARRDMLGLYDHSGIKGFCVRPRSS